MPPAPVAVAGSNPLVATSAYHLGQANEKNFCPSCHQCRPSRGRTNLLSLCVGGSPPIRGDNMAFKTQGRNGATTPKKQHVPSKRRSPSCGALGTTMTWAWSNSDDRVVATILEDSRTGVWRPRMPEDEPARGASKTSAMAIASRVGWRTR